MTKIIKPIKTVQTNHHCFIQKKLTISRPVSLRILMAVSVLAHPALPVQAQTPPAQLDAQAAEHLASLKEKLNLSAGQEVAWGHYAAAVQRPKHPKAPEAASANKHNLSRTHQEELRLKTEVNKQLQAEARSTFRAQLTAQQQAIFDQATAASLAHRDHPKEMQ